MGCGVSSAHPIQQSQSKNLEIPIRTHTIQSISPNPSHKSHFKKKEITSKNNALKTNRSSLQDIKALTKPQAAVASSHTWPKEKSRYSKEELIVRNSQRELQIKEINQEEQKCGQGVKAHRIRKTKRRRTQVDPIMGQIYKIYGV